MPTALSDLSDDQKRLLTLELEMWGRSGRNGLRGDVKDIKRDLAEYIEAEDERRANDSREKRSRNLTVALALFAAVVSLIGTVSAVLVAVSQ